MGKTLTKWTLALSSIFITFLFFALMFSFLVNIVTYFLYGGRIYPLGIYITVFTAQKQ